MPEKRLMARSRKRWMFQANGKPSAGGSNPTEGSIWRHRGVLFQIVSVTGDNRALAGLEELVVHAEADDVVIHLDVAGREHIRRDGAAGKRREGAEVDIEEFALDRPAITERLLGADTHGPPAAGIGLGEAVARVREQ